MEFHKNQFYQNKPTKIAGNKVFPNNNPFEISKQFLNKQKPNPMEEKSMTPEQRFEAQKNQKHFFNHNPFQK